MTYTKIKDRLNRANKAIRNKYSQKGLARQLGISQPYLNLILNRKRPIPKHLTGKFQKLTQWK